MKVSEALERRRAIRDYDPDFVIPEEVLRRLFSMVKLTPSPMNLQPWEFIVVRNAEVKKKLRACANNQVQVELASATVIVLGNTDMTAHFEPAFADLLAKGGTSPERIEGSRRYVRKFDGDLRYRELWVSRCAGLAAMTLMLAAQELGLDSGPMDGFSPDKLVTAFNIPPNYLPVMLIALGRRAAEPPFGRLWRREFDEMVHIDNF
ncbi:MAG: nitroreductase family protein [Negativicutes bacterium]|nr:nitroreductase family protein [Negativicutes bacterium]